MSFQISVVSNTPLTPIKDLDEVATRFLTQVGYLPKGYDPKTDAKSIRESVPYRMFVECFLCRPERGWTVEELAVKMETTKPTIYRHLNKLKSLDILEEMDVPSEGGTKKGYRIRYGDLGKAWSFVEANVEMAMENYRRTAEHLQKLAKKRR